MNRILNFIILIVFGVLLINCGPSIKTGYDFDTKENFERFSTFEYITFPENSQMNEYVLRRTKVYLNQHLEKKGMKQSADNPDLLIAIHTQVTSKVQVSNLGYAYAPQMYYWSSYGYFRSYGWELRAYHRGTLVVDFVDAKEKEMVWRGVAEGSIPEIPQSVKIDEIVNKAVNEMMKNYPPPPPKNN